MESGTFVRRVVFALYFLIISTLIVVAGVAGLFGSVIEVWLETRVGEIQRLYGDHKAVFDWSILILGSSIPAVTGVLAILKGFYYAERNLPDRLNDLLENASHKHLAERPAMLAYVTQPIDREEFLVPSIYSHPFARLGRMLGISSQHYRTKEFACSVDLFNGELNTLSAKTAEIENRMVTGRLIRGAHFSAKAAVLPVDSSEWRDQVSLALDEYRAALKIRGSDLDALEGAAVQHRALGNDIEELKFLARVVVAAEHEPLRACPEVS